MRIVKIGRNPSNDIQIDDPKVTRSSHCHLIINDDNTCEIVDMNSKNGVFVNGWRISGRKVLNMKDKVKIGDTILDLAECIKRFGSNVVSDTPKATPEPPQSTGSDKDYMADYIVVENDIKRLVNSLSALLAADGIHYEKIFQSSDEKRRYYIDEYRKKIFSFRHVICQIEARCKQLESLCDGDLLSSLLQLHNMTKEHVNEPNSDRPFIEQAYKVNRKYNALKSWTVAEIKKHYQELDDHYSVLFDESYDTASPDSNIWMHLERRNEQVTSMFRSGLKDSQHEIFDEQIVISERYFVELINQQHLSLHYDNATKSRALDIVNTLVSRLMATASPGKVVVTMIDADEMDGTCDIFKRMNRNICQILSRQDEIRRHLDDVDRNIGNIIQNLLLSPINSLFDYNQRKDSKEAYRILIVEDYPSGISGEGQFLLEHIMKSGVRAGVNVVLLVNEDKIGRQEDQKKILANVGSLERLCGVIDIRSASSDVRFDSLSDQCLHNLVQYVNTGVEIQDDEIVLFTDYMQPKTEWWSQYSAKYIEIPFGVSVNKQIQSLKITQESGQNSAVVIGIPGSGKSVFLHSIICSAAIKYSPDELRMYLIDFSGVEFNVYALGNLPHARVIAPEAEREFGLSILNELVEEGSRRMELCRSHNVNNIVELKRVVPDIKIPRLLVIIDEFQKLFENESDQISREANAKIHTIIQEFRKFGINLILATQKLPSGAILPRDLIANRVVFKSTPVDFQNLITMENSREMPRLRTGECIYNSESGASYDNVQVQSFFIQKQDIDRLLDNISGFRQSAQYVREPMLVFRSNELPEFQNRRMHPKHQTKDYFPNDVPIYLGESIAVNSVDVNVELARETSNNLLIIGGEPSVAERIAYNSVLSAIDAHEENSAKVIVMNGMRSDNPLCEEMANVLNECMCNYESHVSASEIERVLTELKNEVDARRADELIPQQHIYLTAFNFQNIRAFDKDTSSVIEKPSASSKLMDYIIKNGSSVGVFCIVQVDALDGLNRVGNVLSSFNYRVALQMPEDASYKIVGSQAANKLFVFNRPASRFRAYMRDNIRNVTVKFKPYK